VGIIRLSTGWVWDRFYDLRRPLPIRPGFIRLAANLDDLSKIHIGIEGFFYRSENRKHFVWRNFLSCKGWEAKEERNQPQALAPLPSVAPPA
jgi:hypothetical protein